MEQFDLWDFDIPYRIALKPEFLRSLITLTKEQSYQKVYKKGSFEMPYVSFRAELKPSFRSFRLLKLIVKLCNILRIPLSVLRNNITMYKISKGSVIIYKPILPISCTPVIDMLLAHHFADGNIKKDKGRHYSFGYRQYDTKYRELYIEKMHAAFGFIQNLHLGRFQREKRVSFPAAISPVFLKAYGLEAKDFLSCSARIPCVVFTRSADHRLAFILGFIIDEGYVDSTNVLIRLKNTSLSDDLALLCESLGYSTVRTTQGTEDALYIHGPALEKLYADYLILVTNYPCVNLGWKGEQIALNLRRRKKPKLFLPGNKKRALEFLHSPLTVNQLALKLDVTRQGARYLVKELINEERISVAGKVKWHALTYIQNDDRSSGRSFKG